MNRRTLLAAGLAAIAVLACTGSNSAAQADGWGSRADAAIERAIALDLPGKGAVFNWAYIASAVAKRSPDGWQDPRALTYLRKVLDRRHPDGGYGLDRAHDLFSDGTLNPAGTAYTVTMTDHVGKMLLEAHAAGVVHRYYVDTLLAKLQSMPRVPVFPGYCWSYSDQLADAKAGMCVHNANAGVAEFLSLARKAGFDQASQWAISLIAQHETYMYRSWTRDWPYRGNSGSQGDSEHNAYVIEAMMEVAPGVADAARVWVMSRSLDATSAEAHARLARFDCGQAARWLPEFDARMATAWVAGSLERQAHVARLAAETAEVCEA